MGLVFTTLKERTTEVEDRQLLLTLKGNLEFTEKMLLYLDDYGLNKEFSELMTRGEIKKIGELALRKYSLVPEGQKSFLCCYVLM